MMSRKPESLTLNDFVKRKLRRSLGASGSLRVMLSRSLGASSPRIFWQYWNPIFGYYLGRYVYANLRKGLPSFLSIIITFIVSGLIHDLVTITVNGSTSFFFSLFFLLLSIVLLFTEWIHFDLSQYGKAVRVAANMVYLISCFTVSYYLIYLI